MEYMKYRPTDGVKCTRTDSKIICIDKHNTIIIDQEYAGQLSCTSLNIRGDSEERVFAIETNLLQSVGFQCNSNCLDNWIVLLLLKIFIYLKKCILFKKCKLLLYFSLNYFLLQRNFKS